jgi:fucose permease
MTAGDERRGSTTAPSSGATEHRSGPDGDAGSVRVGRRWLILSFAGLGATAATVSAVLPAMAETLAVPVGELTAAVPAVFLGVLGGVLVAPLVGLRMPTASTVRIGSLLQAAGLLLAAVAGEAGWFVAGAAVAGFGFGLVEVAGSASTHSVEPSAAPQLLLRLTLVVAIVATLIPVLVLGASALGLVRVVPLFAATLQLLAACWPRRQTSARPTESALRRAVEPANGDSPALGRVVLLRIGVLAAGVFCYVGIETVLSGWSAATLAVEFGAGAGVAALGTSAFWLLISLGRLSGAMADRRLAPRVVLVVAVTGLTTAVVAAALTSDANATVSVGLSGVAVFFAGPCYAVLLGTGLGMLPATRAVPLTSTLVALGAAGGAVIPLVATTVIGFGGRSPLGPAAVAAALLLVTVLITVAMSRGRRAAAVQDGGGAA